MRKCTQRYPNPNLKPITVNPLTPEPIQQTRPKPTTFSGGTMLSTTFHAYEAFTYRYQYTIYCTTLCISTVFAVAWCPSVCPSRLCIVSRRQKMSNFFLGLVAP